MDEKTYKISADLLQRIVDYLQVQPWNKVNNVLAEIINTTREQDAPPKLDVIEGGRENKDV
jgi:hypothetical protein